MTSYKNQKLTLPSGKHITVEAVGKIHFRKSEPALMLQYSTTLDLNILDLLQSEIDEIWSLFRKQADESGLSTAIISVNSPLIDKVFSISCRETRNFVFEKDQYGFWRQNNVSEDKFQADNFKITFGVIENRDGLISVFEETRSIPLLTKDSGFYFGFTILPSNNSPYDFYCVLFPPDNATLSDEIKEFISPKDSRGGFRAPTQKKQGISTTPMWFDRGDPPGKYQIEVYINGMLARLVNFTAYESK